MTPWLPGGLARCLPRRLRPVWRLPRTCAGQILLTFDDGPAPGATDRVLDVLREYGLRAVFFVLGRRVTSHPELARRIHAAGHVLGNHSHDHPRGITLDHRTTVEQVLSCQEAIRRLRLPPPRLYRPPEGRISLGALRATRELGLVSVLWTRETRDWAIRDAASAEAAGRSLAVRVRSRDIVLLHDQNPHSARLLRAFLASLTGRRLGILDPIPTVFHRQVRRTGP